MNERGFYKNINFNNLILEYYKELNLSLNEVLICLMSNYLLETGTKLITNDLLEMKLSLSKKEIDIGLSNLMNKNYIKYIKNNQGLVSSLDTLYDELLTIYSREFISKDENKDYSQDLFYRIVDTFEKLLDRNLNQNDIQYVEKWVNNNVDEDIVINSLKDAISYDKPYLPYIDQLIEKRLKEKENAGLY